jgi:hypothetical protein
MRAECLISTEWYTLTFEAGRVYDIDEMLYPRLLRSGKFIPAKDLPEEVEPEVEQPETEEVFKPVATFVPLPETDDLAKPLAKPAAKPIIKRKRK